MRKYMESAREINVNIRKLQKRLIEQGAEIGMGEIQ